MDNKSSKKSYIITLSLWFLLFAFVLLRVSDHNFHEAGVSGIYYDAAKDWLNGKMLYTFSSQRAAGFLYLPNSAVILTPFTYLSLPVFVVVFRAIFIITFIYAIYLFSKLSSEDKYQKKFYFTIISIITIPLSMSNLDIGQLHFIITGFLLIAIYLIEQKKYWASSALIVLSLALKPIFLPVYLIMFALFPKLRSKIIIWTAFFALLPFFTQNYSYVISQYKAFYKSVLITAQVGIDQKDKWAQIFNSFYTMTGVNIYESIQLVIRIIMAALCLLYSYIISKKVNINMALTYILCACVIYILLLNPRTENNDYIMIMPFMGYFLVREILIKNKPKIIFISSCYLIMCLSYTISSVIITNNNIWLKPFITFLFGVYFFFKSLRETSTSFASDLNYAV